MKKFTKILAAVGSLLLLFSVGGIVSLAQVIAEPAIKALFVEQSLPTVWFLLTKTNMIWPLIIALLFLIGAAVIVIIQWRERVKAEKEEKAERKAEREKRKADRKKHKQAEEDILEDLDEDAVSANK